MKVKKRRKVFDGGWFEVIEKEIMINGDPLLYYIPKINLDAVVIIPLEGKRVYLVNEWRSVVEDYVWHFPIGGIERGSPFRKILAQAKRELREEAGLEGGYWRYLLTTPPIERIDIKMHFFLTKNLKKVDRQPVGSEAHSIKDVKAFSLRRLQRYIMNGRIKTTLPTLLGVLLIEKGFYTSLHPL